MGVIIFDRMDMLHPWHLDSSPDGTWMVSTFWLLRATLTWMVMYVSILCGHTIFISHRCVSMRGIAEPYNNLILCTLKSSPSVLQNGDTSFHFYHQWGFRFLHILYNTACLSFLLYVCWWCWRRQWYPTPVLLPEKSHGRKSLVGCSPWGCKESNTTERLHSHFHPGGASGKAPPTNAGDAVSIPGLGRSPGGGHDNPFQYSFLGHPIDRGVWRAMPTGLQRIRHNWSGLACMHPIECEVMYYWYFSLHFLNSVAQSCLTLHNRMDCSTPGFPAHHHLLELAQTHILWVSDTIQPSRPLLSPPPPAFNLSQHQGLF